VGWTSENVAHDFNISREDMDAFAAMFVINNPKKKS
jgi:acetyl-CoA acyltransferase 1